MLEQDPGEWTGADHRKHLCAIYLQAFLYLSKLRTKVTIISSQVSLELSDTSRLHSHLYDVQCDLILLDN